MVSDASAQACGPYSLDAPQWLPTSYASHIQSLHFYNKKDCATSGGRRQPMNQALPIPIEFPGRRFLVRWAWRWLAVGLALALGMAYQGVRQQTAVVAVTCPAARPVLIDPGHGGIDGGTNRGSVLEKEIVLDIALRMESYLKEYQVPVLYTRTTDLDLGGPNDSGRLRRDINYRHQLANRCNAVFLMSLHVNSASSATERGMMIFYQPSRPSRDAAYLFDTVLRQTGLNQRRELPHPHNGLAVLRWSQAPALLVELGFITHPEERQELMEAARRERIAQALANSTALLYQQWIKQGTGSATLPYNAFAGSHILVRQMPSAPWRRSAGAGGPISCTKG